MKRLALLVAALLGLVTTAHASPPSSAARVDPQAPCFRWPAVDMDTDGVFDRVDHCVSTPKGCVVDPWGCSLDGDQDGVCDGLDRCADTPKGDVVDEHGCSTAQSSRAETPAPKPAPRPERPVQPPPRPEPAKPISGAEQQLVEKGVIRLENVYFETGSARLLPESEANLNEAGAALQKYSGLRVEVEGHTDTRGDAGYNRRLSQERAETVRRYLADRFGLDTANLMAHGYGETRPETAERNDEELLRNRRVVLRVLNPEALPRNVQIEK